MLEKVLAKGIAQDEHEVFEFKITPYVTSGFLLTISFHGDDREGLTGSGMWPTIEKAKQIAEETASKRLHGAKVSWSGI